MVSRQEGVFPAQSRFWAIRPTYVRAKSTLHVPRLICTANIKGPKHWCPLRSHTLVISVAACCLANVCKALTSNLRSNAAGGQSTVMAMVCLPGNLVRLLLAASITAPDT
ncbi:hypothetical protein WJX82_005243 [Trebouxia sp. C0006]